MSESKSSSDDGCFTAVIVVIIALWWFGVFSFDGRLEELESKVEKIQQQIEVSYER